MNINSPESSTLKVFQDFIKSLVEFPLKEWVLFSSSVRIMTLSKGEHLFRQGESSEVIGVVTKGLIQTYYLNSDGEENTKTFVWEGRLIGNWAYQIQGLPAGFSARALEKTTIVWIPFSRFEQLQSKSHAMEKLRRKCAEAVLIERERRERELLTLNARQRYDSFLKDFAPILNRVPQYLVASYLGITPVALSRMLTQKD